MKHAKIICFAATVKPESARNFYQKTLGLKFVSDDPFAVVFDVNGTMLRVQKVEEFVPARHTVLGWEVADIRVEVEGLVKKGVRMERFPGMEQDELGVWTSPAGGKIAWFKDPDGNILSLTEFK
jgi:predicted enzyme related to lactoylglutathione lyase